MNVNRCKDFLIETFNDTPLYTLFNSKSNFARLSFICEWNPHKIKGHFSLSLNIFAPTPNNLSDDLGEKNNIEFTARNSKQLK